LRLRGSGAVGFGARLAFAKNATDSWFLGHHSSIEGFGTSSDLQLYNGATTIRTFRISATDDSFLFAGAFGYQTGSGGTVTQGTNKSTGVSLNKPSGKITMNNAALAGGGIVNFVLTNSYIGTDDVLVLNHVAGGTPGNYVFNARAASGSATIDVRNNTAGSLSDAIVLRYVLIRAATS
jgi:hypothetical protein